VFVLVNVGEFGFKVGVLVNVRVGVNVGDQQSTSNSVQFDAMVTSPVPPINA